MKPGNSGLKRIPAATKYSWQGLRAAWRNESAFRQECLATVALTPIALWLGETTLQRVALIGVCLFVLVVELLNSAIESVVDRVGHEPHSLSGQAKDMGSAAVFLSFGIVIIVWLGVAVTRFY